MLFLNVRDKLSHPYKITGKIIIPFILIFIFLDSKWEDNDSGLNGSRHSQNLKRFWRRKVI
jgi:hypothetical protein